MYAIRSYYGSEARPPPAAANKAAADITKLAQGKNVSEEAKQNYSRATSAANSIAGSAASSGLAGRAGTNAAGVAGAWHHHRLCGHRLDVGVPTFKEQWLVVGG